MNEDLLSRVAPDAKAMVKEAVAGIIGKVGLQGLGRIGQVLVKNPVKSGTMAMTGFDVGGSVKQMNDLTTGARNIMNSKMTVPANL